MKTTACEFWNTVVRKKTYWIPMLFFATIAYGFSLFNRTVGLDNIAYARYYDWPGINVRSGRWGSTLIQKLIYGYEYSPFLLAFLCLCSLLLSAVLICLLLYIVNGKNESVIQYTIFSALYITYPLIGEIWTYYLIQIYVPLCFAIAALIYLKMANEHTLKSTGCSILLFFPAAIGYEITYLVYITLTLMIIFLEYGIYETKRKGWFREGIIYAIPLIAGCLLRAVIGKLLLVIFQLPPALNGQRVINWGKIPLTMIIKEVAYNFYYYFIRVLEYVPIGIFVGALFVFVLFISIMAAKYRKLNVIGFGILVLVSLFSLSILQGSYMSYRTAWSIIIFVPFVGYLCVNQFDKIFSKTSGKNKQILSKIIIMALLYLAFQQGTYLHYILALDNQRSDNEMAIARQLGYHILSEYNGKKVVFVGEADFGDWVNSQIVADEDSIGGSIEHYFRQVFTPGVPNYKFTDSIVLSVLNGAKWTTDDEKQLYFKKYFSYLGYDIMIDDTLSYEELQMYERIADEKNMMPFEMIEVDDVVLVNLG